MIDWLRRRSELRWTRRTTWTPLLLRQRQLQRVLAKERSRADRDGSEFGLIILRVSDMKSVRKTSVTLAKILHRRLRDTDEKGHLNYGRIGVMLPSTGELGTQLVLNDILRLAESAKLKVDGEAFVYPERPNRHDEMPDDREETRPPKQLALDGQIVDASIRLAVVPIPISYFVAGYPTWKRTLDVVGAVCGICLFLPLIAIGAFVVCATSRGPAFFSQERIGYLGRRFRIYKLRTMVVNAEELKSQLLQRNERDGPAFKMSRRSADYQRWLFFAFDGT